MAKRAAGSNASQTPAGSVTGANSEQPTSARRATRSRSHEPQSANQPANGRIRRTSRQGTAESDAPVDPSVGVTDSPPIVAGHGRVGRVNPSELEPVDEEGSVTYGQLNDLEDRDANSVFARQSVASFGGASTFTSHTNKTTFSQDEILNLDADTILGGLAQIDASAEDILEYVAPSDAQLDILQQHAAELLEETTRFRKRLNPKLRAINALEAGFGQSTFINAEHVLRFLLHLPKEMELLSTAWRPDEIFYKVNLVTLLQMMFYNKNNDKIIEITQTLDMQFPRFAMATLVGEQMFRGLAGESKLVEDTWNVAIELRTQLFIHVVEQGILQQEPLESILLKVFLVSNDEYGVDFLDGADSIRLRPFDETISTEQNNPLYSEVYDRFRKLRTIVSNSNEDIETAIRALKDEFSWGSCCLIVLAWVQERHKELRQTMEDRGGIDLIVANLENEVQEVESRTDPMLLSQEIRSVDATPKSLASKSNIEALRKRRQRLSSQTPASIAGGGSSQAPTNLPFDEPIFVGQDNDVHLQGIEEQAVLQLASIRGREQAGLEDSENRRRFIDQQNGAHRVRFDDTQGSMHQQTEVPTSSRLYNIQSSASTGRKRQRQDDEESFEPSQDEGFQTDQRVHDAPHRAPQARMTSDTKRNVLPRTSYARDVADSPAPRRERQNPGRSIEAIPPPTMDENGIPNPTSYESYKRANQMAKMNSQSAAGPPRQRTRFSAEEEQTVLDLIGEFGPQFSKMKAFDRDQGGNVLEARTAEDIRFKARNMKMDYLKSGVPMPPGFENVLLARKEMLQLDKLGIPYEQQGVRSTTTRTT